MKPVIIKEKLDTCCFKDIKAGTAFKGDMDRLYIKIASDFRSNFVSGNGKGKADAFCFVTGKIEIFEAGNLVEPISIKIVALDGEGK